MTMLQTALGQGVRILTTRRSLLTAGVAALAVFALTVVANPTAGTASSAASRNATGLNSAANPLAGLIGTTTPKLMLAFTSMIGNSGPYVGPGGALRGIPAGGAPWKVSTAAGELFTNGRLIVFVKDLTLLNGTNPVPKFDGAVSCQSIDSHGNANIVNVFTGDFPASSTGTSLISTTITLPSPCFAPIVFVTSPGPGQAWFATTGN